MIFLDEVRKLPEYVIKEIINILNLLFFVVLAYKGLNLFNQVGHVSFLKELFHNLGTYANSVHLEEVFGLYPLLKGDDALKPKNGQRADNFVLLDKEIVLNRSALFVTLNFSVSEF